MSWNPRINRQDAIETACHNAIQAIRHESEAAARDGRSFDDRLALAAALEAIQHERSADQPDVTAPFDLLDCIEHLRRTAAPRRSDA